MAVRSLALSATLAVVLLAPAVSRAADDPLALLKRSCAAKQSADKAPSKPVAYRICTAKVASFDGTPLDATLTLPARTPRGRLPLVVFLHGFLADKTEYLSDTREGTGPDRGSNAYKTVEWNNIWFASRGYAVLNYSARGQGDSGGEIGLASKDLEVRDTRFLTSLLADDRISGAPLLRVDRKRIGVIGSSYGGGQAWLLLTTRESRGEQYGTWRSPRGQLLKLAALSPQYTWTDLLYSLVPNGRHSQRWVDVAKARRDPIGIGKQTLIDGFLGTAGTKLPQQTIGWLARFNVGEPYDGDATIEESRRALTEDRSAFYQDGYFQALASGKQRRVPVFAAQGWTDPIFPAIESLRMYRRLRVADRRYPIQLYFGDFEHLTALVKVPDLRYEHGLGNRLFDHYLLGSRARPRFDVRSATSNCDKERFGPVVKAPRWDKLATGRAEFDLGGPRQPISRVIDPNAAAFDPVVASQLRGRGCITASGPSAPGVATYTVSLPQELTLTGLPRLTLRYRATAADLELNSRLWDVAPDGSRTLVTRGAYRATPQPGADATATYELFGNAWTFPAGHSLLLEVTQDDSTYLRADNVPSTTTIDGARLELPTR